MGTNKALTFSDVLIKPKYSTIDSRSKEVDIGCDFGKFKLDLPVFSANMKSITEHKMAIEMYNCGGMGVLHRFCTIEQAVNEYKTTVNEIYKNEVFNGTFIQNWSARINFYSTAVSIGVQEEDRKRFEALYSVNARVFVIDIAHGHCKKMKEQIQWIKNNYDDVYIIAGNIATPEAARDLAEWGANVVKCGIGPGSACMTRRNTGVGVPALYAAETILEEITNMNPRPKLILDGGIKYSGDVSKALKYADAVMLGSYISGTTETPGQVFKDENDKHYKVYQGSASGESKIANGQTSDYVEGIAMKVPFRGHVKYILKDLKQCVQSAFSYTNSRTLDEFHKNCEFIEITGGGKAESKI